MENTVCQNNTKYAQQVIALKSNIEKTDSALAELETAQKQFDVGSQERIQLNKEIADLQRSSVGVNLAYYEQDTAVARIKLQVAFLQLAQIASKINNAGNSQRKAESKIAVLQAEHKKYLMIIAQ